MTRRFALAVALAVTLAGCSAFGPAGDAGTPRETVTPLSVPTETPAPGESLSPPPGVAANGSISPSVVGAAHRRALVDRSFTWTVEYERRDLDAGVTVDAVSKRLRVGSDGSYVIRTVRADDQRQALYADETGAYSRTVLGNVSMVHHLADAIDYRDYLTTTRSVQIYLGTEGASVSRVELDGRTFYRLHVTAPPPRVDDGHPKQTVRNYSATAYLTPAGLVRSLVVRYDYELRADRVEVFLRADYERVDETTVTRPAWAVEPDRNRSASAIHAPTTASPMNPSTKTATTDLSSSANSSSSAPTATDSKSNATTTDPAATTTTTDPTATTTTTTASASTDPHPAATPSGER
ncbi:hypothetical protein [Halosimplex amylolyticum]|uniref:hypothetical protein n=1 Tax=Halosimplex amylolyticum TaxID=3396616 RepID=UPI003F542E5F